MRTTNSKILAIVLGLSTLALINPLFASSKMGGDSGGGGDASEERVNEIRSDILNWIKNDGAKGLNLPNDLSYGEYVSSMTDILQPKKVIIGFVEKEDPNNEELKVSVNGVPKTCRGFISAISSKPHIICNISRFNNTAPDKQYKLIHHEFAGLVNVEKNEGAASDYSISTQITEKTLASIASDMQTVKYAGHSVKYGESWRRRVTYLIPLTKACDSGDLESVLVSAQDNAIKKCEEDGAVECKILRGSSSTTNGDLGCAASASASGKISKVVMQQRAEARREEEVKAEAINAEKAEQERKEYERMVKLERLKFEMKYYLSYEAVTTHDQLEKIVSNNLKGKILLNFVPTFDCGPCRAVTPILEEIVQTEEFTIINVSASERSELVNYFQITSVPTFILLKDGKEVGKKVGALPTEQIRLFIKKGK